MGDWFSVSQLTLSKSALKLGLKNSSCPWASIIACQFFFTFAGQLNTDFLHSCTFLGTGSAGRYNKVHWCTAVCTNPSSGVPSRHSVNHRVFWIKRSVNIISKFKISSHLLSFAATKLEFQFIFSPSLCLSLFPALVGTLAKKIQHSSPHTVAWMAASCFSG